jgi:hypothetical protein
MNRQRNRIGIGLLAVVSLTMMSATSAKASTAYGTLNNFDCVNDTGQEAHGFEIELDDIHSTDITYTYDYNHYGIPSIREDNSDPLHPRVFIRYAAKRNPDGSWTAFTAIPSGPISPTDGHQFTNPSVNFGGEHFGVGNYGAPTAVKYNWLIDDGTGNLVHGPPVYVATPTFTYYPPVGQQPAQVQAVVVPPPPPAPPVLQFGEATWVKDIKTTTHNAHEPELRDLVDPDPDNPNAPNWANGEPAEVETEWRILQTEFGNPDNPNGELAGAPDDLPGGDEVITRRYEFYKYVGPIDGESGEAMADAVGPDGIHGVPGASVTYNDHIDPLTGEWVQVTIDDLGIVEVVGEFFGAQMSGFDIAPALGLIDHIPDGELGISYADRRVVISGGDAFLATVTGSLPDGTTLDEITGIFSGTPTAAGVFTFTVGASDTSGTAVSKEYTVTIPEGVPVTSTITTSALPLAGGTTTGDGVYNNGTPVTVIATHNMGYDFVNWTEGGVEVSVSAVYPFTVNADRNLVANFILVGCTSDADCADADACTTDVCVNGDCQHQAIAGCCNDDGQCDDGDACTRNACVNHACTSEGIPGCCNTVAECDDGNVCTADACIDHVCLHDPMLDCCNTDAECLDDNPCTMDECIDNLCRFDPIPGCCLDGAECDDGDVCTMDSCIDFVCTHDFAVNCCHTDGDCEDSDVCTLDRCLENLCMYDPVMDCCTSDAECSDGNPCTTDACVNNLCEFDPIPGCCISDAECADDNICTRDLCINLVCERNPIAGCCAADADCGDLDACTLDRCVGNVCEHVPGPDCCILDEQCVDDVSCTVDRCIQGICQNIPDDALCGDSVSCTMDRCDPSLGCVHVPNTALCDDGLFCNGMERCNIVAGCLPANRRPCPPPFCDEEDNVCVPHTKLQTRMQIDDYDPK